MTGERRIDPPVCHPESAHPPPAAGVDPLWDALLSRRGGADGDAVSDEVSEERALLGYAPTALLAGCWLTSAVQVRRSHSALGASLLDALFHLCGEGDAARHQANLHRALLAGRGLSLSDPASPGFIADERLHESDFRLALAGLRLGCQEDEAQIPYVLGFHAAATVLGPPAAVRRAAGAAYAYALVPDRAALLARRCLEAYAAQGGADWSAVWSGVVLLVEACRAWHAALLPTPARSPWQAMIELIEAKARHGFGFHRSVQVRGRSLDDWLDPTRRDAHGLLSELSRSRWIVPGRPDDSPLLARSVQFGGPMFGIFTEPEITIIRAWIDALPDTPQPPAPARAPALESERAEVPPITRPTRPAAPLDPLSLPQLYHRCLCSGLDPETRVLAREHVRRLLRKTRSATSVARLDAQGLWPYAQQRLADWVDARLHEQVFTGSENTDPEDLGALRILSRADTIFLLTQIAPSALVDGAWLQGSSAPSCFHTPVSALLLRIYRDELGAGVTHQHHGNVMRRTLAAEGVTLPPCDSPEFSAWPGFLRAAFSTPVLWLSMALHSAEFLPELLGLNLAIEMAGVGHTYGRAIALLRAHRIDPYYFELHNTIDNAATGHVAWSVRAIALHMDDLMARGDTAAAEQSWLRIWRGHAAHAASSAPLERAVALRLGPGLGWRWLRQKLRGLISERPR